MISFVTGVQKTGSRQLGKVKDIRELALRLVEQISVIGSASEQVLGESLVAY